MGNFNSFAEVLEEKIRAKIVDEIGFEAISQRRTTGSSELFDDSPSCLSHLLGSLAKVQLTQKSKAQAYHKHRPPPRPRPPHVLNQMQGEAFSWFLSKGASLTPAFNLKEVKSAFRALALKLHPDQGGTAGDFMQLKKSFDLLVCAVTK